MRIVVLIFMSVFCFAQDRTISLERFIPSTYFKVKAEAGIWYKFNSCANVNHSNKLTKPFIICEGFDIDGSNNLSRLFRSMGVFLKTDGTEDFVLNQLRVDGWDVIIVNLLNNGEAIENNALLVEQLLKDVDAEVLNNHTTYGTYYHRPMLMGISMGALIGRVALARMERNGVDHKVEKFISFDGPHKGANIPLALQAFVNKWTAGTPFANQFRASLPNFLQNINPVTWLDQNLTKGYLTQTAAYQMAALLYGPVNLPRTEFLAYLELLGNYPQKCRLVGIANGANGIAQPNISSGSTIFSWTGFSCLLDMSYSVDVKPCILGQCFNFSKSVGLKFCPFTIEEKMWAMPSANGIIENTTYGAQRGITIDQGLTTISVPSPLIFANPGLVNSRTIDYAPGGQNFLSTFGIDRFADFINNKPGIGLHECVNVFSMHEQIGEVPCIDGCEKKFLGTCLVPHFGMCPIRFDLDITPCFDFTLFKPFGTVSYIDDYSFVPTVSALDINRFDWFADVSQKGQYPHDKNFTPFDAIYWHDRNSQHAFMDFGNNNAQPKFMMEEISPDNLFIQNRPFPDGYKNTFEARGYIAVGKNVDQVPSRSLIGDVVLASNSDVTFSVGAGYGNFVYFDDGFDSGNSTVDVVYNTYGSCTKNFNTVSTTLPRDQVWQQLRKESDEPQTVLSKQPEVTSNNEPQKFDLQAWINEGEKDSPLASFQVEAVPNPFNSETTLSFYLSETSVVSLDIYDAHGVPVSKVLDETILASGNNSATVSLVNQLPGLYIYKIVVNGKPYSGKLIKQ